MRIGPSRKPWLIRLKYPFHEEKMNYDEFFTPRIILMSDGEADSRTAWRQPMNEARQDGIMIDSIALLSRSEKGRDTLEEIAAQTNGDFLLPDDLQKFIAEFVRLSKKKKATKVEDIILCLDVSGSMSEHYKGSNRKKIKALKEAVLEFAAEKLTIDPRDRVGIVVFGTHGYNKTEVLLKPGPYSPQRFESIIKHLKAQNGTPLAAGLKLAVRELNVKSKRSNFKMEISQPLKSVEQIPGGFAKCKYCMATHAPKPDIDAGNWPFFEGVRKINVFRCPKCGVFYHGMCFDKHVTRGGNAGVCYGCNSVLGVEADLQVSTPATARVSSTGGQSSTMMLMCPQCNEPLPNNAKFCSFCGQRIDKETMQEMMQQASSGGPKGTKGYVTPSTASSSQQSWYNPATEQGLVSCPSCGYACHKTWGECPMCSAKLGGPNTL